MVSQLGRAPAGVQAVALFALAFSLTAARSASAHMGSTKTIDAEIRAAGPHLVIQVDAVDAAIAIGLGVERDSARLFERETLLRAWLTLGIQRSSYAAGCVVRSSEHG